MNNLNDMAQVLRQTPTLESNKYKKIDNINNALEYFDKKNSMSHQGSQNAKRLNSESRTVWQFIFGRETMKKRNLIIGGVVSVCAVASVILVPRYQQSLENSKQVESDVALFSSSEPSVAVKNRSYDEDQSGILNVGEAAKRPAASPVTEEIVMAKADVASKDQTFNQAKEMMLDSEESNLPAAADEKKVKGKVSAKKMLAENEVLNREVYAQKTAKTEVTNSASATEGDARATEKLVIDKTNADKKNAHALHEVKAKTKESTHLRKVKAEKLAKQQKASEANPQEYQQQGQDKFEKVEPSPIKLTQQEPVSTFSIDVDTASYSFVRASLNRNVLPQKNAVRLEELVNYFPYDYAAPENKEQPFKTQVKVFPAPWNAETKLMHIGIKGYQLDLDSRPRVNLVFLVDTSGSMNAANKLPLLQASLKMLLDTLHDEDSVAIVTYAGNAGTALEATKIKHKNKIINVIDNLGARGSTAGAEGIRQAYQLAEQNFDKEGVNRVLLATDGDFNVGITNREELKSFIERKRKTGVTLSILGFGMGNYNDQLMQVLAQNGNGNAAYIDNLNEARKTLVQEAGSTLFTIAKDVKIQVEFNPEQVAEYRLLGYETRKLKREDFNNDKVDAGDIGAGHSVTALYEITPVASKARLIDDLRYQKDKQAPKASNTDGEYAFVKIRYKLPSSDNSTLITTAVDSKNEYRELADVPTDSRFATSVAAFAQLLRAEPYLKNFSYQQVIDMAMAAKGEDKYGYRAEFINLVRIAKNAPALQTIR